MRGKIKRKIWVGDDETRVVIWRRGYPTVGNF
jgi:hypothetical protein